MHASYCCDGCVIGLQPDFASEFIFTLAPPVHHVPGAALFFHIPVAILDDFLLSVRRQSDVVSLHGRIPVRIVQWS